MSKKKLFLQIFIATCCLMAPNVWADEALLRKLSKAIDVLDQRDSYRWTTELAPQAQPVCALAGQTTLSMILGSQ